MNYYFILLNLGVLYKNKIQRLLHEEEFRIQMNANKKFTMKTINSMGFSNLMEYALKFRKKRIDLFSLATLLKFSPITKTEI